MSIAADERRTRILEIVRKLGTVRVTDLAARLDLPAVTVRRDVATLAETGLLRRSHGSVSVPDERAGADARTLGLIVPTVSHTVSQYFDEVIAGARAAAADAGAHLVLGISSYDPGADRGQAEQLLKSGAEGLMLTPNWMSTSNPDDRLWLNELPVPTVLVERRAAVGTAAAELDSVSSDHHHGVLLALRHLAALGHDTVALAARRDTWTALKVRSGYAEGCATLGLTPQPVIDIDDPATAPERVAGQLAEAVGRGVRAALVHNDQDAIQLPALLRARGLSVPEDLALISYDDVFAALGAPPLTAVAPPKRAVGAAAVDLLLRRLRHGSALPIHRLELLPELKVRASCGRQGTA
ncbi:LacI family DNA-binding transcriptional regulator [Streptomyces sp. 6-11-2]|uniref:LacI family DNA-binding transcriptional regulator n=1 Tax=Streptomyces sp. 6-11-2 TaxID=2585753 RepID=UPI001142226B|nr:LacI family DNA-binding transcriptional regulator [Streptomyces sp. 6-11-2]GED89670.1 LacI family transcriptional regulator [Streptomyces sp. 6-11-2]